MCLWYSVVYQIDFDFTCLVNLTYLLEFHIILRYSRASLLEFGSCCNVAPTQPLSLAFQVVDSIHNLSSDLTSILSKRTFRLYIYSFIPVCDGVCLLFFLAGIWDLKKDIKLFFWHSPMKSPKLTDYTPQICLNAVISFA